jgi:hypothetical protein
LKYIKGNRIWFTPTLSSVFCGIWNVILEAIVSKLTCIEIAARYATRRKWGYNQQGMQSKLKKEKKRKDVDFYAYVECDI